jgi:hypothetical protein
MLGLVGLTLPPYLILSAVYPELPEEYVEAVKLAFGTYDIDASNKYFRPLGLKKKEQLATIAIKKSSPFIQRKQPASSSLAKQRQISSASSAPGNDISSPPPVLEHLVCRPNFMLWAFILTDSIKDWPKAAWVVIITDIKGLYIY